MARPIQEGLSYFPFDTNFFSDRKIKSLKANFGADGITFYMYLLCEVYRDKGYYLQAEDDFLDNAADDLGMSVEKIGLMMNFLLKRSLFDNKLFQSDKVLTSCGIQRRYQKAIESIARKTPRKVRPEIWLLEKDETKGFIQCALLPDSSEKNDVSSKNNSMYFSEVCNKGKETKRKESKGNENKGEEKVGLFAGGIVDCFINRFGRLPDESFVTNIERVIADGVQVECILSSIDYAASKEPRQPESYVMALIKVGGPKHGRNAAPPSRDPTGPLESWEQDWLKEIRARKARVVEES